MKYRRLTINTLPRVMVAILAFDKETREILAVELSAALGMPFTVENMAERFHRILDTDKAAREALLPKLTDMLDHLRSQDWFGTEGQIDPRGDRRD